MYARPIIVCMHGISSTGRVHIHLHTSTLTHKHTHTHNYTTHTYSHNKGIPVQGACCKKGCRGWSKSWCGCAHSSNNKFAWCVLTISVVSFNTSELNSHITCCGRWLYMCERKKTELLCTVCKFLFWEWTRVYPCGSHTSRSILRVMAEESAALTTGSRLFFKKKNTTKAN